LEQAKLIPLGDLQAHLSELDSTADHVVLCRSGARSAKAVELLLASGIKRVKNLKGGILAWAREVDTTLPLY
jgi:adenylyltransferase/sulfurtransferase